jgi:hypothetical protein
VNRFYELAVRVAATLPATLLEILILPARCTTRLVAATLPATLSPLSTLTALTTLLLAVSLSRVTRIRASHNTSQCKGPYRLWRLLLRMSSCNAGSRIHQGDEKGLNPRWD